MHLKPVKSLPMCSRGCAGQDFQSNRFDGEVLQIHLPYCTETVMEGGRGKWRHQVRSVRF